MIAYLDASVLLRVVFGEPGRLSEWSSIRVGVTSRLARIECLRTIDRMRLRSGLDDAEVAQRTEAVFEIFDHVKLITLSNAILERAAQPFSTTLGTLDALHLASALMWQKSSEEDLIFATHDIELGRAARASELTVLGC